VCAFPPDSVVCPVSAWRDGTLRNRSARCSCVCQMLKIQGN
jgi:hypothetical protein